jgi:hypothetical protein
VCRDFMKQKKRMKTTLLTSVVAFLYTVCQVVHSYGSCPKTTLTVPRGAPCLSVTNPAFEPPVYSAFYYVPKCPMCGLTMPDRRRSTPTLLPSPFKCLPRLVFMTICLFLSSADQVRRGRRHRHRM